MLVHEILRKYFIKKKKRSRGYSLRTLAQEINLSPSFVSRMLSGARPVPDATLDLLATALEVEAEVMATLRKERLPLRSEVQEWELADQNHNRILRQWFYLPLLELTTLKDFDGSVEMLARRLQLSLTTAEIAVRELMALGLLQEIDGKISKTQEKLRWSTDKSLPETRAFHHQMMTKAQNEMRSFTSEEDFQKRLIMGITVSASSKKIAAAKKKLNECLYEIANDLIQEKGDEVYHLSGQLFPLTKRE